MLVILFQRNDIMGSMIGLYTIFVGVISVIVIIVLVIIIKIIVNIIENPNINNNSKLFWVILLLTTNIVGLIVYMITKTKNILN